MVNCHVFSGGAFESVGLPEAPRRLKAIKLARLTDPCKVVEVTLGERRVIPRVEGGALPVECGAWCEWRLVLGQGAETCQLPMEAPSKEPSGY